MKKMEVKTIEGKTVNVSEEECCKMYRKMNLKRCESIVIHNLENCGIEMKPEEVKKLIEVFEDMYYTDCDEWERIQDAADCLCLSLEMNFKNSIKYDNNYKCIKSTC